MTLRRTLARLGVIAVAGLVSAGLVAVPAQASTSPAGERSLAALLTSDGNTFDHNWYDYDIVTEAVLAVLAAKPSSPVGVLADGSVPLTAFIPNDRAFQVLVRDLTGRWPSTEKKTFEALVGAVGVDAVEAVLLYHVVPGATIRSKDALKADGAKLATALPGAAITVDVKSKWLRLIELKDLDRNDANPWINPRAFDLNKGNKQIAHGITLVLRPLNL
ncbi:fasciclin domain-containing protein [Propionicimonas paludicola]|uniref:Fasciclin domain-containing protein n=1 Tax=Propionicimonas paludicola TaxID=185243 RepID=A0A2A9CWX4_9ACTN|nr:fasciclin domain-containing protein [Propionicimonas paludicola]PFG18172.1 fasciclin domain-containing protein [Propionicimonas paludicola]